MQPLKIQVVVVAWFCSNKPVNDPVVLDGRGTLYEIAHPGHPRNGQRGTITELEAVLGLEMTIDPHWEADYCARVHRRRGAANA